MPSDDVRAEEAWPDGSLLVPITEGTRRPNQTGRPIVLAAAALRDLSDG